MTDTPSHDHVLILDFGSQVTQLIARRVREAGVYCEIWPFDTDPERIRGFAPKAVILSGGPASVTEATTPRAPQLVFDLGVPVLGICYGQMTSAPSSGVRWNPPTIASSAAPSLRSRATAGCSRGSGGRDSVSRRG